LFVVNTEHVSWLVRPKSAGLGISANCEGVVFFVHLEAL